MQAETVTSPTPLAIAIDTTEGLSPEQVRLFVADRILRVLALTKKREPKKALARLIELNAVRVDNAAVLKRYNDAIVRFTRYGRFYLTNPQKIKRKALTFLGMHAEPLLKSLFASLEDYLAEHRARQAEAAAQDELAVQIEEVEDTPEQHKFISIGSGLEALRNVMPRVLERQEQQKVKKSQAVAKRVNQADAPKATAPVAKAEQIASATDDAITSDDAYVLDLSGRVKMRELDSTQSAVIRASVVLTNTFVSEIARRQVAVDFGMQRVLGSYLIMSEALVIGLSRYDEYGDQRPDDEVKAHARRLLALRNAARLRNNESELEIVYMIPSAKIKPSKKTDVPNLGATRTSGHIWFLLFDKQLVADGHINCQRWEFYRRPGTADVNLVNA